MQLRDVVAVEPCDGYTVRLTFDDGVIRTIDLTRYIARGDIFAPLRNDPAFFRQMRVEHGAITWPNGADIDTQVLYYNLKTAREEAAEQDVVS